ncbi:DUF998 domain-containing protein [Streptomyces sp. enrichment culture]|uniref:DUF998 domain-containing protein n=1 Tax=Streptomyces sp. enrichment culture TaxID=1795815 RepID=UPI003F557D23
MTTDHQTPLAGSRHARDCDARHRRQPLSVSSRLPVGALLLIAAPLLYVAAEAVAAAAWTNPPYNYVYDYVSNLGVPGPRSEAFGQIQHSPLAVVMNAGFITYGLLIVAAAAFLLRARCGRGALTLMGVAVAFGLGAVLLGFFPGSRAAVEDGRIVFHTLGAR